MQTDNQKENVISMFDRKKPEEKAEDKKASNSETYDFEQTMKQNADRKNKMRNERSKANKGVIRSYRLKH
jgi:hypothetical protein